MRRPGARFTISSSASTSEVVAGTARAFIAAKLAERDARLARVGRSPLPGRAERQGRKGRPARPADALLDRQVLLPRRRRRGAGRRRAAVAAGVLGCSAAATIFSGRCAAICISSPGGPRSGCPSTCSRRLARRLGYQRHPGLAAAERFMKHYFLVAKDVGDLTRIVCAELEEREAKNAPRLNRCLRGFRAPPRRSSQGTSDFVVEHGRINVADDGGLRARSGQPDPHLPRGRPQRSGIPPRCLRLITQVAAAGRQQACSTIRRRTGCSWRSSPRPDERRDRCSGA